MSISISYKLNIIPYMQILKNTPAKRRFTPLAWCRDFPNISLSLHALVFKSLLYIVVATLTGEGKQRKTKRRQI